MDDVFHALGLEYDAIESMLAGLDDASWERQSLCEGWTIAEVVLHLAQTEEAVAGTPRRIPARVGNTPGGTTDDMVEEWVASERGLAPRAIFQRWRRACRTALDTMRSADPETRFPWATNPLKPRTLATTRLSEHWIHANDIAVPLDIAYPDTDRLWHIARLAHRTIPYAYARAGRDDPPTARVELVSPSGEVWTFGDEGADCTIRGSASEFCRVAGRRLDPADAATIVSAGDRADDVLDLVRTYA